MRPDAATATGAPAALVPTSSPRSTLRSGPPPAPPKMPPSGTATAAGGASAAEANAAAATTGSRAGDAAGTPSVGAVLVDEPAGALAIAVSLAEALGEGLPVALLLAPLAALADGEQQLALGRQLHLGGRNSDTRNRQIGLARTAANGKGQNEWHARMNEWRVAQNLDFLPEPRF